MKNKFKRAVVVCVLALPLAAVAAEQNPFQSLVSALGKLAPANTGQQAEPQSPEGASSDGKLSGADADILRLFEIQAVHFERGNQAQWESIDGPYFCSRIINDGWLKQQNNDLQMALDKGDYGAARAVSESTASYISYCAVFRYKYEQGARDVRAPMDPSFLNYSMANWAEMVGTKLVLSLKYARAGSIVHVQDSVEQKTAARAKAFLLYAKSHNSSNADAGLKVLSDLYDVAKASGNIALSGSAVSLVEKFNSNKFGFEQKYLGKTIETYGSILTISGSKQYASVAILGNTKLSKDELGFQHRIECIATSPESMSKVADLERGKKVKVRGVFDHDTRFNMMAESQINLSGCEILQ